MKKAVIGYPRLGEKRELKRVIESYLKGEKKKEEVLLVAKEIRKKKILIQKENNIDYISSNDFSYYDNVLDTIFLLGVIPQEYEELNLDDFDTYFALAKGYQKNGKDIKALPMKKWFNTNYHYLVPELSLDSKFKINITKLKEEYLEAKELGVDTKPVIIGPFTFLKLAKLKDGYYDDYIEPLIKAYREIFAELNKLGVKYLQIDEPALVKNLCTEALLNFDKLYEGILEDKNNLNIIIQSYFGHLGESFKHLINKDIYGIGVDLVEGIKNIHILGTHLIKDKVIFAGLVNGKNIWKNNYKDTLETLDALAKLNPKEIVINTSCSLLHVPYTLRNENKLEAKYKKHLSFAEEKLNELKEIGLLYEDKNYINNTIFTDNQNIISEKTDNKEFYFGEVREKVAKLKLKDFDRKETFNERNILQKEWLKLPHFPTTTIGSFPQTNDVRKARRDYKLGLINEEKYHDFLKEKIARIIKIQEELDLDLLVHGEYERNDMVEYFGENLEGFLFTENAWVQSYGTRGVKPPIIFGDVKRIKSITTPWSSYAQSLTKKPLKGMLTGPITIQNWSFVREDLSPREIAYQIAFAIQEEVLDLEKNNINIIQIDEAALREKLPLRKEEWGDYLDWAIKAFRLCASKVKGSTQIHTHMCYSEFKDIMKEIKDMDADVITIESAKSDLSLLEFIKKEDYDKEIGPGVYDIHSPRVPSKEEIINIAKTFFNYIPKEKIWINPDCGLKTRGEDETFESLKNMVEGAKELR